MKNNLKSASFGNQASIVNLSVSPSFRQHLTFKWRWINSNLVAPTIILISIALDKVDVTIFRPTNAAHTLSKILDFLAPLLLLTASSSLRIAGLPIPIFSKSSGLT